MSSALSDAKAVCLRYIEVMTNGSIEDFEAIVHPDAVNRQAKSEPLACRGRGPAAYYATALWVRDAFADLHWEIHDVIAEGDLVALHCTMSGRHTGTVCDYREDGRVSVAFPPTGRRFAATQTQWYRITEGKIIEYWANRDDLGMSRQMGWLPPAPLYLLRMVLARVRARRGAAR
ncbi:MAG TPA: ester cyclase [Pseudonocardiaceae bacterium]|nr:ester cyclase [Pseudonocardiaceae bacterium]